MLIVVKVDILEITLIRCNTEEEPCLKAFQMSM